MATAAFKLQARRFDAPMIALVKVSLVSPTTRTLYLSSNFVETPDYQLWEGGVVEPEPIKIPGNFLSAGPDLCTTGFSLASRHGLGFQAGTKNITDLFADFRWIGARVDVYLWSKRLTSAVDKALVFSGIVQNYKVRSDVCEVRCIQRQDWNRILTPTIVARDKYPRAPDRSVGLPLPIAYGAVKSMPLRTPPWPAEYSAATHDIEHISGGQIAIPAVCVDTGRGGAARARYLVAGHAVKAHNEFSTAIVGYFIRQNDLLVPIEPTATVNDANGAGFELADDFAGASYPVAPSEVVASISTPGDNLRYALDEADDTSFAKFVYQPSPLIDKRRGEWRLPDIASPGDFALGMYVRVGYKSSAALTNFYVGIRRLADSSETRATLAASTTPARAAIAVGGVDWANGSLPVNPWALSEIEILARWDGVPGALQEVWIYYVGLEVVYKPRARIYAQGYTIPARRRPRSTGNDRGQVDVLEPSVIVPPDTEIEAEFFGTVEGVADDGSGTYSGVAAALIERPCDIARHLLRTYGGQSAAQVQAAGSVFGSFVDARAGLKTWRQTDWRCALQIAEVTDLGSPLRALAEAGLSWCYIDRFTDQWHWVPWRIGAGTDYARKVYRDDLIELEVDIIPAGRQPSGIKIAYGWDARRKQFTQAVQCSKDVSRAGHRYLNMRDQYLTVVADVNDKVQVDVAGTPYTHTLAAGVYSDATLLTELQKINTVVNPFAVGFGGRITAGANDKLNFYDGAIRLATLDAGLYSMEALATHVAAKMNALSTNWSCSYSRSTRKFTVSRSSGTAQLTFSTTQEVAATLGFFNENHAAGSPYVSDFEVEEERIAYSASFVFSFTFATGTNGSEGATPKHAADLLGFDARFDMVGAKGYAGQCPKGTREQVLAAAAAAYGNTRELVIEGRAIYDTDTARELRNRLVDLLKEPRVIVRFKTTRMPDVHRGELIRFDDLDNFGLAFPKQGSDGSWVGKRFAVLNMLQRLGPTFDQEIEAIEIGDETGTYIGTSEPLEEGILFGDLVMPS